MAAITDLIPGDRGISIGNEQFMRTMSIGDNWLQIRFGIHFWVQHPLSTWGGSFLCGLCSGGRGWFDPNCHIVCVNFGIATNPWPYQQTYTWNGTYWSGNSNFMRAQARVGSTVTNGSGSFSLGHSLAPYKKQFMGIFIDRTPGRGVPHVYFFGQLNAGDATDYTPAQFIAFLETQSPSPVVGDAGTVTYAQPGTPLDTVWFYNTTEVPHIQIFNMGVARVL